MTYYDKALDVDSSNTWAWNGKGDILKDQGKYDQAITYYDKALDVDSSNTRAWNGKGYALYYQGNYTEAITYFDKSDNSFYLFTN